MSSSDHVGLEKGAFEVHVVVVQSLVHSSKHLDNKQCVGVSKVTDRPTISDKAISTLLPSFVSSLSVVNQLCPARTVLPSL